MTHRLLLSPAEIETLYQIAQRHPRGSPERDGVDSVLHRARADSAEHEIERLRTRNAQLERVAGAARELHFAMCHCDDEAVREASDRLEHVLSELDEEE
jgi:hypothetical protein